jgi:hypothetical protein
MSVAGLDPASPALQANIVTSHVSTLDGAVLPDIEVAVPAGDSIFDIAV